MIKNYNQFNFFCHVELNVKLADSWCRSTLFFKILLVKVWLTKLPLLDHQYLSWLTLLPLQCLFDFLSNPSLFTPLLFILCQPRAWLIEGPKYLGCLPRRKPVQCRNTWDVVILPGSQLLFSWCIGKKPASLDTPAWPETVLIEDKNRCFHPFAK